MQKALIILTCIAFTDYVLGTVHKSKGLEFDTVVVTDDFAKVPCSRHNLPRVSSFSTGLCVFQ